MILFFHGLTSSSETSKFQVIKQANKFCQTIDYETYRYQQVSKIYDDLIQLYQPKLLVGHSLGGYWALTKSNQYHLPCAVINPALQPSQKSELTDYPKLKSEDMDKQIYRAFHIEFADEVLDMQEVYQFAQALNATYFTYPDGHHRVHYLDEINHMIEHVLNELE